MSDFWKRVDEELEFLGKTRTYIAKKCDFSLSNFSLGLERGSTPSAETAVKIAAELGVSVEYLVNGAQITQNQKITQKEQEDLRLSRKYHSLIQKCETLSPQKTELLSIIADNFKN